MPSINRLKTYADDSYYHLYNRGVDKIPTFRRDRDYKKFISYLEEYLTPKDVEALQDAILDPNVDEYEKMIAKNKLKMNNFTKSIELIAYNLQSNHFHLVVKQTEKHTIDKFMNSLITRYVKYFNTRYGRVGGLFQEVYKAVLVKSDEQLTYLIKYVLIDQISSQQKRRLKEKKISIKEFATTYTYSSIQEFLNHRDTNWIHPKYVQELISPTNNQATIESFLFSDDADLIKKYSPFTHKK